MSYIFYILKKENMNKKIRAIVNENILFAFRESLLWLPIFLYIIVLLWYWFLWQEAIVNAFREVWYVSVMSSVWYFLSAFIIIYYTIISFDKDIKTKNIYIVLQHVNKKEYFLWKLISIFIISFFLNIIFMIIFNLWYLFLYKDIDLSLNYIFVFQQLELLVIAFFASLFSLLSNSNAMRILLTLIILILGHSIPILYNLTQKGIIQANWISKQIIDSIYYITPNLELLNVKDVIIINSSLWNQLINAILYTVWLIILLYFISMKIFNKKDF